MNITCTVYVLKHLYLNSESSDDDESWEPQFGTPPEQRWTRFGPVPDTTLALINSATDANL